MYYPELYSKTFSDIFSLIIQGEYTKAIEKIESTENDEKSTDLLKLECTLLKGKIYNDLEQQLHSKSALEELWIHFTELKNQFHQIEIYFILLQIYIQSNDKKQTNFMLDSAELVLKILDSVPLFVQSTYQTYFIFLVGLYHIKITGDMQQGLFNFNDCLENFTRENNSLGIIQSNYWLGLSYFHKKEFEISINFFFESLEKSSKINNQYYIAKNYYYIGKIYSEQEKWIDSSIYYEKSLDLIRKLMLPSQLVMILHDTIEILFQLEEWSKLEQILVERLHVASENNMETDIIKSYYWYAYYYEFRGMIDEALVKYQETLEYLNKIEYLDEIHRCSSHISFLNTKKHDKLPQGDWIRELQGYEKPWKIVIVCNGNISRSPYTEFLVKKYLEEEHSELMNDISIESLGVLYQNKEIHPLSKKYLLKEGFLEEVIETHQPRFWKDYPELCEQATIFVTMTGEQANLVNFFYPGKAFMLSYIAEGKYKSVIDPAIHRKDAENLFLELKRLSLLFSKNLIEITNKN